MKIVAEFNSIREMKEFAELIAQKEIVLKADYIKPEMVQECKSEVVQEVAPEKEESKVIENKEITTDVKEEVTKESVQEVQEASQEVVPEKVKEDSPKKLTKEDIREIFSNLIKAGKQKEAKELTNSYGAKRIPDLKEEDYPEVYEKAEKLLKGESIDE